MNGEQVADRLRAYHAGKPLPRYDTRHFSITADKHLLILAFARMGGESAPWGIAAGRPGQRATLLTVPEARNRDLVADMAAKFAPILLEHFYHPVVSGIQDVSELERRPLPQLWLPNASHLEMLHYLAYSYTFTKWGDKTRAQILNRLGRLAGWLFRESQRPGQVTVMLATEALKTSYSFPAQDIRQSHLGFLLAWLTEKGNRDRRTAVAAEAERIPMSTSLDPALERDQLADEVERYNDAIKTGETRKAELAADTIRRKLQGELVHRFDLVEEAIAVLRSDPRRANAGLVMLENRGRGELWREYLRREVERQLKGDAAVYTPSPETDRSPAAAAANYYRAEASEELHIAALLQDDPAYQDEMITAGKAFRGTITTVADEGTGRAVRPIWTLKSSTAGPTRLRAGSTLCVAGCPKRELRVRRILDRLPDGSMAIEFEVTALKTIPRTAGGPKVLPAIDPRLMGTVVTLVPVPADGIAERKASKVWQHGVPGEWLTGRMPGGRKAELPDEVADDLRRAEAAIG
jgi:hypothetical protein